jgi:hypothetical protein
MMRPPKISPLQKMAGDHGQDFVSLLAPATARP